MYIGTVYSTGTSVALPAHQAGDLIVVAAVKFGNTTIPSLPAGYTSLHTSSTTHGRRLGYKIAASSAETTGTWTNATTVVAAVYRGMDPGAVASSTSTIPGLTLNRPGLSWVWVYHCAVDPITPSGWTARLDIANTADRLISDSAAPLTAWAGVTTTTNFAFALELVPATSNVDSDVTTSWQVAEPVQSDATTSWEIDHQWVDSDATTSWQVAEQVNSDAETSWMVDGLATYRDLVTSPAFIAALTDPGPRTTSCRVIVVDQQHRPVYPTDRWGQPLSQVVPVTAAEVSMRGGTNQVWSCRFTIADPRWAPRTPTDPLHPLSPYRLAVFWLLQLPSGLWAEVPLSVYRTGAPTISKDGAVTVDGLDVASVAKRGGYGGRVIDVGGMTADAALRRLFATVAPTVPFHAETSTVLLPDVYELGRRKPSEDWEEIAALAGMVVRADRYGTLTAAQPPNPHSVRLQLVEGPGCPMVDINRELSDTVYNRVVVTGTHPDLTEPVYGISEDDDETSPTWVGKFGPYELQIDSDAVQSVEAATNMADLHRGRWRRPADRVTATIRPRPDLDYLDLVQVTRQRVGVAGTYRVAGWTLPLPVAGVQPGLQRLEFMSRQDTT